MTEPGLRERKKAAQRQRIVDVTVELFRERGYEKTTVEEVVRRVEISQPTFYKYFRSKDDVLAHVGQSMLESWAAGVQEEHATSDASAVETLRHLYERWAEMMIEDEALWRCIAQAGALNPIRLPEQKRAGEETTRGLARVIARGQARGELRSEEGAEDLADILASIQLGACFSWAADELRGRTLEDVLQSNLDFFLRATRAA